MKKIFSVIIAIVIFINIFPCVASAQGYDGLSDEELIAEYNAIRLELASRGYTAENKRILLDDKDIQIYISGDYTVSEEWYGVTLQIPVVIINNRQDNITVQMRNTSVNGWACEVMFSADVPAQKKLKDELTFELDETDIETLEDFEDAEFSFHVFDSANIMTTILDSESIHIVAE